MYTKQTIIGTCTLILVLTAFAFFSLRSRTTEKESESAQTPQDTFTNSSADTAENTQPGVYTNTDYGFSFSYPADFSVISFSEETGGDTIRGEKAKSTDYFEIFVSPFDEDLLVMTPERIHEDLPNIPITDPQEVVLGDGTRALIFKSFEKSIGDTREVWIIHDGYLYQGVAPFSADTVLAQIMTTWKFDKSLQ